MRKLSLITIITVTLGAVWLNSCCKHKEIVQESAIDLGISDKGTKAVVDSKADLISQALASDMGFGVYGYKSVTGNDPLLIFDNVEVKPESNVADPNWTYAPTRYWDKNPQASYQFIAYWPHLGQTSVNGAAYATQQNKVLTIHDIPFWQDGSLAASADFMTAERVGNYSQGAFTDEQTGITKVRFTFSHILAKLVIKAYYVGVQANDVSISGIRLTKGLPSENKILSSDGKASYSQPFGTTGTAGFTGNTPSSSGTHTLYNSDNPHTLSSESFDDEIDPEDYVSDEICQWLMVPCSGWNELGLSVDYSIGGSSTITTNVNGLTLSTTIDNQVQTGQTASGKSYIITLKFDSSGGGVDLQSVLVRNWTTQDVPTGVYNW